MINKETQIIDWQTNDIDPTPETVSYTHLDVYKRQGLPHPLRPYGCHEGSEGTRGASIYQEYLSKGKPSHTKAVSYTHLDVYKRQYVVNNK